MKPLLCNFGVMILLLGPFIIIPAMVIGFGLFLFGNEEVALWVCGTAAAVSLYLDHSPFERSPSGKGKCRALYDERRR